MPVEKFRTFQDAADALWMARDDPRLPGRLAWVLAFSARVHPLRRPPGGVRKYRSLEEAQQDRESWR